MKKLFIGSAISTAMLLVNLTPALAADVTIKGNGADSTNNVSLVNKCDTTAIQSNNSATFVMAGTIQGTGNNTANNNTGGDVTVTSGDTASTITTTISGDRNTMAASQCCCSMSATDTTVKVAKNGKETTNTVTGKNKVNKVQAQRNNKLVGVGTGALQGTGNNTAKGNTVKESDKVSITSGNSTSEIDTTIGGNANSL